MTETGPTGTAWRWSLTFRCAPLLCVLVACPLASVCLTLVTETYPWPCRPLTGQICFCAFVVIASCAHVQELRIPSQWGGGGGEMPRNVYFTAGLYALNGCCSRAGACLIAPMREFVSIGASATIAPSLCHA